MLLRRLPATWPAPPVVPSVALGRRVSTGAARGSWLHAPPTQREVVVSTSLDPLFNLALEEVLLRMRRSLLPRAHDTASAPTHRPPTLLLYRNAPCLVLGRNQNPWTELNPRAMHAHHIPLVRRRSGGGAVYHDEGNSNYSLHLPREEFTRAGAAQLVARAMNKHLGLQGQRGFLPSAPSPPQGALPYLPRGVYVNERNDLCLSVLPTEVHEPLQGEIQHDAATVALRKPNERKLSGSAYKITSSRAYHHGTMLLSAQLERLGSALSSPLPSDSIKSKGVDSVRAPVTSLATAFPSRRWSHNDFVSAIVREFAGPDAVVRIASDDLLADQALRDAHTELGKWEWIFGQTPEFTLRLTPRLSWGHISGQMTVRHGRILRLSLEQCDLNGPQQVQEALKFWLEHGLVNTPFDQLVVRPPVLSAAQPPPCDSTSPPPPPLEATANELLQVNKDELFAYLKQLL